MKILGFGILFFAMALCGFGERVEEMQSAIEQEVAKKTGGAPSAEGLEVETPILTPEQQKILESGTLRKWDDQHISWTMPQNWNSISVSRDSFNYGSPDNDFIVGSVSNMSADFPAEMSLKAVYDANLEKMDLGDYENVRWLEIDGIKGIEWIDGLVEKDEDNRRHYWMAFRNYQGHNQQITIILSTNSKRFDNLRDTFAAILYSMKISKS